MRVGVEFPSCINIPTVANKPQSELLDKGGKRLARTSLIVDSVFEGKLAHTRARKIKQMKHKISFLKTEKGCKKLFTCRLNIISRTGI